MSIPFFKKIPDFFRAAEPFRTRRESRRAGIRFFSGLRYVPFLFRVWSESPLTRSRLFDADSGFCGCHAVLLPRLAFVHACHAVLLPRFCVHSRLPCGSVAAFCVRSRLPCGSVAASGVRSRLSFSSMRKKKRLAICSISIPRGRNRHLFVLMPFQGYRAFSVHFGFVRFFMAIPTGLRNRRRGVSALFRKHISFVMLSAGSTLGAARPQTCAKGSLTLWTLFIGFAAEYPLPNIAIIAIFESMHAAQHLGTRKDLTDSNKRRPHCGWPVRSGCLHLTFLALRGSK